VGQNGSGVDQPNRRLDEISTHWGEVQDPRLFVVRYASAIRAYLRALLPGAGDADDVEQQFLLNVVRRGFGATPAGGRFRDYLKTALRNAAITHLRRKRAAKAVPPRAAVADDVWTREYRECVLAAAWQELDAHQQRTAGNLAHTVLRLVADHPEASSAQLVGLLAERTGRTLSVPAFRKQLSRGRRLFARFVVAEVSRSLNQATPDEVMAELAELKLLSHLNGFLPGDTATPPAEPG
jgi:DNA-directed RNA polymerase specialized sigma24 family protein